MPEQESAAEQEPSESIGRRIQRLREESGLSLSGLAAKANVSKGYLWSMESGTSVSRPSANTLYAIADALGVTIADLSDRPNLTLNAINIPPALREFATSDHLPETDVQMLAGIQFRGERPRTVERWRFIYSAIRHSAGLDAPTTSSAQPDS
jgi:transcriptional regulator with XRE-family HTH domain